jgi:hypothetical protein
MILKLLYQLKATLDYLGGVTEEPFIKHLDWMRGPIWWGLWWAVLLLLTLSFSGQTSKFIYIDF